MPKLWKFKSCEEALVERLFSSLSDVPRPIVRLLIQRGCKTEEQIRDFMNPSLSGLRDPFELPDMQLAVDRIRRALAAGERIAVFGDYDADGICSTSMLVRLLRALGGTVGSYIPNRLDDGYGLSIASLTSCVEKHTPTLIITVDCGTNSVGSVERAREQGIDVIITDHHEVGDSMADALAVVNPKRVENHPASILAGVGVAFKLCHALIKVGRAEKCPVAATIDLREFLDFVAVATVTDMVPLVGENRALVRAGFHALENSIWPGWNALKTLIGIDGVVETWHAGFSFGPRINAAGRIGRPDAALDLFLTDLPAKAKELAKFLDEANHKRQMIERDIVAEALEEVDSYFDAEKTFGIVIAREGWHPGVIGIVASRLVQRYRRPTVVIGMDGGAGRGSCRSVESFNILDGLRDSAELLSRFGGHEMAAGIEMTADHVETFRTRFNAYVAEHLDPEALRSVLHVDVDVDLCDVNAGLLDGLRRSGPFGQENPEPVWAIRNAKVVDRRVLKEKHLKLTFSDGKNRVDAIGFNMADKLQTGHVDVAFTLQENTWNGRTSLQLNLKDIRDPE